MRDVTVDLGCSVGTAASEQLHYQPVVDYG